MSLVTKQDVIEAFGEQELIELTNLDVYGIDQSIDDVRLNKAIAYAESIGYSYVAKRHSFPLPGKPLALLHRLLDIARYQLEHGQPREDVQRRYTEAIKWLEGVAKGDISLGLMAGDEEIVAGGNIPLTGGISYVSPVRIFE